jgi:hypothetical protein
MAGQPEDGTWPAEVYQLETTDAVIGGVGGTANLPLLQLANRTGYLRDGLTAVLEKFYSHDVTIFNRGIVRGCVVTKGTGSARTISIAAGRVFAGGGPIWVPAQPNGASVPANTSGASVDVWAFVDRDGQLGVTGVGEAVPDGAVTLQRVVVPNGNTEVTDPDLVSVTLTEVAPREPDWPALQRAAAYLDIAFEATWVERYSVTVDIVSWEGERPLVLAPSESRTTDGYKLVVDGSADTVRVRTWLSAFDGGGE